MMPFPPLDGLQSAIFGQLFFLELDRLFLGKSARITKDNAASFGF
jgi:hypothetical protein